MKKSLILLLIFMFISNLIKPINAYNSNISTKKDTNNSKPVIDKIVNYDLYTKGIIVALNDYEALNDLIETKMIYYVSGYNDNDDYASLTYDYVDISNVNLQKAGTYPAYTKLKLMDDCVDDFVLADNIESIKFNVYVSDPNVFDVFITSANSSGFTFSWLDRLVECDTYTLKYIESIQEINYKDLKNHDWQILRENVYYTYYLPISKLTLDKHYYFYFTNDYETSNFLHIYYDNNILFYESMGGDRDGGDYETTPPPDVEQPAPDIKLPASNTQQPASKVNQSLPVSANNHQNTFKPNEHFSESKDELSGQRVLHMQQISKNELKFSKHGILVTIPNSTIDLLNLKDNDIFSIEINKINDYRFKLDVTLNDKKIDQLKDMKIMVPCTLNKKIDTVAIIGPNNEKITGTYDASSKLVTFIADYPGTYKIEHKQTTKDNNAFNYLPVIISAIIIICLISFLLIKRGKNYAKKIY